MFPGQGAQRDGMLHALPIHTEVTRTLVETTAVLGSDCLLLDQPQALLSTYAVQLCLLIAGVAMARVFAAEGIVPDQVAGLSIGAFPAAVVAGVLDYGDAVRLVQQRATMMAQAYPTGYGMAAISGLDCEQLDALIAQVFDPHDPVYLANLNGPRQLVIAGSQSSMASVLALALLAGATRAQPLAVTVPSHCALFDAEAQRLQQAIAVVPAQQPQLTYLSANLARALFDPLRIKQDLAANMATQVHWFETMRLAWERGARLAIEMPGGTVLKNLVASQWSEGLALACDDLRLDTLVALCHKEQKSS